MNSDFSKSKAGDRAWTICDGWQRIEKIEADPGDSKYRVHISGSVYAMNGKYCQADKAPSAFLVPPAEFNASLPPYDFKEGDKVLVWNNAGREEERAYFSHLDEEDENYKYNCFCTGDKWTSHGDTRGWKYCKAWEGDNERNGY
jgi:hypothetical protein